jgi:hypothetical protein
MANRSDFNSVFPRQMKRVWTLSKHKDAHEAGEMKRLMIDAHKYYKAGVARRQRNGGDGPAVVESDVAETINK